MSCKRNEVGSYTVIKIHSAGIQDGLVALNIRNNFIEILKQSKILTNSIF